MKESTGDVVTGTARRASAALGYGVGLKVARYLLAVASHVAIRRLLGAQAFGQYSVAVTFLDVAAVVASLGMGQAVLRFLPEATLGSDARAPRRIVRVALTAQLIGWAAALGIVWALGPWLVRWFRTESSSELVLLGAGLLCTRLLFDLATQVFHAMLLMGAVALATLLWQVTFMVALVASMARGLGPAGILWAAAWANVVGFIVLAVRWRGLSWIAGERVVRAFTVSRLLRYAMPFAAINVCYNLVWRSSETFWINYYWDDRIVGWFSAAYNLSQLVLDFIPTAIWPLVMASYSTVFTVDRPRALRLVTHYYKLLFLVAAPLSVGGAVLGDRLLEAMYGADYAPGGGLARLFFLIQCASFLGTPLSMTLYVLEKTWVNLIVWIGAAIVNVGLNVLLIPLDWRLGSVLPVALAVCLMPVAYGLILRRLGIQVRVPWRFLLRVYGASSALLLLWPLRGWAHGFAEILVCALLGCMLLAIGLKVVRVFRAEDAPLIEMIPYPRLRARMAWFGEGPS